MTKAKQWTLIALCAVLVLALGALGISAIANVKAAADDTIDVKYTQQAEDSPYFDYDPEQNRYTLKGIENIATDKTAVLTLKFTGDKYLSFSYELLNANTTFLIAKIVVDGSSMTKSGMTNSSDKVNYDYGIKSGELPATGKPDSESKAVKTWVHVTGDTEHTVTLTVSCKSGSTAQGGEVCYFENFEIASESNETKELVVVYDSRLAQLSFNGKVEPAPEPAMEGSTIVEHHLQIPVGGDAFALSVDGKEDIRSTIDPRKTTTAKYSSQHSTTLTGCSLVNSSGNVKTYVSVNFDDSYGFAYYDYSVFNQFKIKNPEQDSTAIVRLPFKEVAPKPDVSITKTSDGVATTEQLTSDCSVAFPYGSENHLTVRITPYEGFDIDKYVILLDNQPYQEELQYFDGCYGFVLNDVYNRSITLGYEDRSKVPVEEAYSSFMQSTYSFDETLLSFTTYLTTEKGEQSIVKSDNVTVENTDAQYPWRLDPEFSTEDRIVYTSGFVLKAGEYTEASEAIQSYLQITTAATSKESGVLSFEFRFNGEYFMAMGVMGCLTGQAYYCLDTDLPQDPEIILGACVTQGSPNPVYPENIHLLASPKLEDKSKEIILHNGCTQLSDGWYRAEIRIDNARVAHEVKLVFLSTLWSTFASYGAKSTVDAQLTVRDVRFNTDSYGVTVQRDTNSKGSLTATIGENAKTCNSETPTVTFDSINAGSYVMLHAEPGTDETFYGWAVNGGFYSREQEVSVVVGGDTKIVAYMAPKNYYKARNNGYFYTDLEGENGALTKASAGDKIVLVSSGLTISQNAEIKQGVTLILPFNEFGEYYGSGAPSGKYDSVEQIAWASEQLIAQNKKFELTIDANAKLTINGTLIVGGVLNHEGQGYQGHTSGAYAELVLNGNIEVASGGVMDVYGRVTGKGSIDVKGGGKLYQPFLILDFPGGSLTLSVFTSGHTPFKRYAMVNIEVPFTIEYGGQLVGHASLWALGMLVSLDQPFISDQNGTGEVDTMIMLKPNASVKVEYDPNMVVGGANTSNCTELIGKTTLTFNGGADFSYMRFSAMGLTVPTCGVYFSIPYNYHLILDGDGTYETRTDFMIMPGAVVEVKNGSTLLLHANTWVYDGYVQDIPLASKSYPTADELATGDKYSKNGNLIVDGKLIVDQKWDIVDDKPSSEKLIPATFLGIIQTNGTGTIEIKEGTILNGKIADGLKDKSYFEYTSTARVWDATHSCFGELVAGETYKATSGEKFKLGKLLYATAPNGAQTQKLDFKEQKLCGSWQIVHSAHHFDWTPSESEYGKLTGGVKSTEMTRKCTELGCTKTENKQLLLVPETLGELVYSGSEVTAEQLKGLLKDIFGESIQFNVTPSGIINAREQAYTVEVEGIDALWYSDGAYKNSVTLGFKVVPYTLTEKEVDKAALQELVYNGGEQTPVTLSFNGHPLAASDCDITYASNKNAGTATAHVTGKGNFAGEFDVTFQIAQMKIVFKATDMASPEGEQQLKLAYTHTGTIYADGEEMEQYLKLTLSKDFASAKAGEQLAIAIAFEEGYTAPSNYDVTFEGGTYTVTDPVFKDVVFADDTVEYDGQSHKLEATGIPKGAEYSYKIDGADQGDGNKAAGDYRVTLSITLHSEETQQTYTYEQTHTLHITQRKITVDVKARTFTYDGTEKQASYSDDWCTTTGSVVAGDELVISLSGSGTSAANYPLTHSVTGSALGNYDVTFTGAASFEITKATVTVPLKTLDVIYGEALPAATDAIDAEHITGIVDADKGTLVITDYVKLAPQGLAAEGHNAVKRYEITATTLEHQNYTFETSGSAAYNVVARNVKVNIADQAGGTYNTQGTYAFDATLWSVDETTPLAQGEQESVLGITLTKPIATNAGSYAITAELDNSNYNVTFAGSWSEEDANKGKAGTYTVNKADITGDEGLSFELSVDGNVFDGSSYEYTDEALTLTAKAYYFVSDEAEEPLELKATTSQQSISETGIFTITVTIDDINYTGETTFTVIVVDADGYTPELRKTLEQLETLCGDMSADTLTATEDTFNALKQAKNFIDGLSEDESTLGANALAPYIALLDSWNNAAALDEDVIATAEAIANAPIKGLMLVASLNILLAAAFAVLKGGLR